MKLEQIQTNYQPSIEQPVESQQLPQPKKFITIISIIVALLITGGVSAYYLWVNESIEKESKENVVDNQNQSLDKTEKKKIIYQKTTNGNWGSDLIISNIDSSDRQILVENTTADYFLIPQTKEVIMINYSDESDKIEKISLESMQRQVIFDSADFGAQNIGNGSSSSSGSVLSFDKKQIVFPIGNSVSDHSKIVLLDFSSKKPEAKIIHNFDYAVLLNYWDSSDKIYGREEIHAGVCSQGSLSVIKPNGEKTDSYFYSEEYLSDQDTPSFPNRFSVSPNGNYFASAQDHQEGPVFIGMCTSRGRGLLKLYSTKGKLISTLRSDSKREFSIERWTPDSQYLIYEEFSWPEWSGVLSDFEIGQKQPEGFVAYNVLTSEKLTLKSSSDLSNWLKENYSLPIVKFAKYTSEERPDDRHLYVDDKMIDTIKELPWGYGPAIYKILGFIEL